MTYSSTGPSLAQALDVDPSSSESSPSPETRSLSSSSFDHHSHSELKSKSDPASGSGSYSHHNHHAHSDTDATKSSSHSHAHLSHAHLHLHIRNKRTIGEVTTHHDDNDDPEEQHRRRDIESVDNGNQPQQPNHSLLHRRKIPSNLHLQPRQADALNPPAEPSLVTQVVQTVSLVQIVDSVGSPIELQTHYAPPATVVIDSASGSTVAIANSDPVPSSAAPVPNPAVTDNVPDASGAAAAATDLPDMNSTSPITPSQDTAVPDTVPEPATETTSAPTTEIPSDQSSDTLSETSLDTQVNPDTASQEPSSIAIPTTSANPAIAQLSGAQNTTLPATTTNGDLTTSTFDLLAFSETTEEPTSEATSESSTHVATEESDSAVFRNILSTSTADASTSSTTPYASFVTSSSFSDSDYSIDYSSSIYSTVSTETWISTWRGDDDDEEGNYGDVTAVAQPSASSTSSSNDEEVGTLSTTQKQVIGGVVGSVAGVAFLALLVLLVFRRKKRQNGGGLLEGARSKALTGDGGPGSQTGGAMSQSSGSSPLVAFLAGLSGKNKVKEPEAAASGERGFYRVSGRKLPSVLQVGGDGYTDPRQDSPQNPQPIPGQNQRNRESVASGQTNYWRGSQAFEPDTGGSSRLALGSPMRPVSGVPIIRTGPARTPVTEENPFSDPPPRPRPDSDALGGSIAGGSIASRDGSRFRERI